MFEKFKEIRSRGYSALFALGVLREDDALIARAVAALARPYPCRSGRFGRFGGVSASHGADSARPGPWAPFDPRQGRSAKRARKAFYRC